MKILIVYMIVGFISNRVWGGGGGGGRLLEHGRLFE